MFYINFINEQTSAKRICSTGKQVTEKNQSSQISAVLCFCNAAHNAVQ